MSQAKKPVQIFERKQKDKQANLTHVEQSVASALNEIINGLDNENKHIASFITVKKAIEIPMGNGKEKAAILIYFS